MTAAEDDTLQRDVLRRHRRVATASLVGAAGVYFGTQFVEQPDQWVLLVRAGAEAGLIGGIADWFAVTALFRRPLGLPIPHTAILPRNKERLGRGLGHFVSRNFLDQDVVISRLHAADPSLHLGRWLARPENADLVADRLLVLAPDVINAFEDQEVRGFYRDALAQHVRQLDLVPVIARLLELFLESRDHQRLFDRSLHLARDLLSRNRDTIRAQVSARSHWWVPRRFDRRLADAIMEGVEEWLGELAQHDHPVRQDFDRTVHELIGQMRTSGAVRDRLDGIRDSILASEELQGLLEQLWGDLRQALVDGVSDGDSGFRQSLVGSLQRFGDTLQADPEARARLDERLEALLRELVLPFRDSIGTFIADVVRDWPTDSLVDRLELAVGRDLQFIRINGTLVGALVGMALFLVTGALFGF
ncbi:DUF445 domain-containing protein [Aquisalimonas asiatica]|uniref:Uncharacterized membrane-anchored protein YjiN, DUF445 family n=1 Tax=Aquisalimonas asiatica TaxID=406100 RepID=A0A1H8V2C1_9GAMM|nr:DUF445 domain-containing protein [Aquisalimonas asiatica]SEP09541.1 Uncharacterized membrane-anchored protein YjiN, DUF445 family [Aquisalimonas asiatica]